MIRFLLYLTALVGAVSALPYSVSVEEVATVDDIKACLSQLNGGDRPLINPQGIQVVADHSRYVWAKPVGEAARCYAFKTDYSLMGSAETTYPIVSCGVRFGNTEIRGVLPTCPIVTSVAPSANNATYSNTVGAVKVVATSGSTVIAPIVRPILASNILVDNFGGVLFEYAFQRYTLSTFYNAAENQDGVYGAGAEYIKQLSGNDTTAAAHNIFMAAIQENVKVFTLSTNYQSYLSFSYTSFGKTTLLDQVANLETAINSRPSITSFKRVSNGYDADEISRTAADMTSRDSSKILFGRDVDRFHFEWTGGETASEHFSLLDVDESNQLVLANNLVATTAVGSGQNEWLQSGNLTYNVYDGHIFDSVQEGKFVGARVQSRIHFQLNVLLNPLRNDYTTEGYATASAEALAIVSRKNTYRNVILYGPWAVLGYKISDVPQLYRFEAVNQIKEYGSNEYYDLAAEGAGRAKAAKDIGNDLFVPVTLSERNAITTSESTASGTDLVGVGVILMAIFFSIALIVSTVLFASFSKKGRPVQAGPPKGRPAGAGPAQAAAGVSGKAIKVPAKVPAPPADVQSTSC